MILGGILAGLSDFTHASVRHYEKQRRSDGAVAEGIPRVIGDLT
jgi:hypothetical protein